MAERTRESEQTRAPRPTPQRSRRGPAPLLLLVLLAGVTAIAVWLGHRGTAAEPVAHDPAPLLPGAPPLVTPSSPPSASVPAAGWDVSHPQCRRTLPRTGGYALVGVSGGRPFSGNSCFPQQHAWAAAKQGHAVYVNSGYPGSGDPVAYGRAVVDDAVTRERAAGAGGTTMWWLDVETVNTWEGTPQQNATVLDAMAARLQQLGARVGIYSTPNMWAEIAGTWSPSLPTWYATGHGTSATALAACDRELAGSRPALVQWVQPAKGGELDHDLVCPAYRNRAHEILDLG